MYFWKIVTKYIFKSPLYRHPEMFSPFSIAQPPPISSFFTPTLLPTSRTAGKSPSKSALVKSARSFKGSQVVPKWSQKVPRYSLEMDKTKSKVEKWLDSSEGSCVCRPHVSCRTLLEQILFFECYHYIMFSNILHSYWDLETFLSTSCNTFEFCSEDRADANRFWNLLY